MRKSNLTGKSNPSGRDPGGFIALPWSVLDCSGYGLLSMHARALLLEVARQWVKDNNGRLLLSMAYMRKRGWKSSSMLAKAKKELLNGEFIFETVKGCRPNKASWYALTWFTLDKIKGYDEGTEKLFRRGAYMKNQGLQIKVLNPPVRQDVIKIAPYSGLEASIFSPKEGAMNTNLVILPSPQYEHHLDKPSDATIST